ncbi:MAG: hypothetical protein Q9217_004115 [Psora testacea]
MSTLQGNNPLKPYTDEHTSQQGSLSFTQGFLLGQISIVILIGAFIKFFVFGEIPSPETTASARTLARRKEEQSISLRASPSKLKTKRSGSHVLRPPPRLTTETILSKTYYNVNSHQPESLDWFNVLIAQTIAQFRNDAVDDDAILTSLTGILNGPQKPDFLGEIKVTEINLGEEFPILSNCRVHPIEDGDEPSGPEGPQLQARMDVDLNDFITLGVDTKMVLNYPSPLTAVLPVALAVSIVRFSGTLSISFLPSTSHPSPTNTPLQSQPLSTTPTTLAFSFLPDYRLDLSIRSLVGSRSRLQDIPKIAQLVESRLHQWIDERCVEPRVQQVALPSLWPRKKNTRALGSSDGGDVDGLVKDSLGRATGKEIAKDLREEAKRELDEERRKAGLSLGQDRDGFEEGLRMRRREYDMPGSMPGMMVS